MTLQVTNNDALNIIHEAAENGVSSEDSVVKLHDMGISVVDSIRIIREAYGVSLSCAKKTVANHPVWKKLSEAATSFHKELERSMSEAAISLYEDIESFSIKQTHSRIFKM